MRIDWLGALRTLLLAILINAAFASMVVIVPIVMILTVKLVSAIPPMPSDEEMIELLHQRRGTFEALVAKVSESRATGTIGLASLDGDMKTVGLWAEEVRVLMRQAGVGAVTYTGADRAILIDYYDGAGLVGVTSKGFTYRPAPPQRPPTVVDLDREDVGDVVRAVLCATDRRPDLHSLCRHQPWVSNLDVLRRHGEFNPDWRAERPIDEHWSLHMMYSWE